MVLYEITVFLQAKTTCKLDSYILKKE